MARVAWALPEYATLFPYHVEVCGFSQRDHGNPGGHILMILSRVCMDRESVKPRLKWCDSETADREPDLATAIGANPGFQDRNWVGIEGRRMALTGELESGQVLGTQEYQSILEKILKSGSFRSPEVITSDQSQWLFSAPQVSLEQYMIGRAFGTDYALALSRSGACWKIPVTREQMRAMWEEANRVNDLISPHHPYQWNFLMKNCDHFVAHILSAAHLKKPRDTQLTFPAELNVLANLSFLEAPSTLLAKIGQKVLKDLPTFAEVRQNTRLTAALLRFGSLPYSVGTLLEVVPFHGDRHGFHHHTTRIGSRIGDVERLVQMEKDPQLTDLAEAIHVYSQKLQRATQIHAQEVPPDVASIEYDLYLRYSKWIHDTHDELNRLVSLMSDAEKKRGLEE
jgi:hypothetical protein